MLCSLSDMQKTRFGLAQNRLILANVSVSRPYRRSCCQCSAAPQSALPGPKQQFTAGLLGAAAGLGILLPGNGMAMEGVVTPPQQQELAAVSALSASEGQQDPAVSPACYMVSSDLSAAPDLVTDSEMDAASSQQCTGANSMQATLVNGLGWMVEEAQEVTNFTESNFAAVGAPSSSMWLSNSPWCLMWDAYCNVLTTRPVATKLATGMVGTFLGDMVAQFTQGLLNTHANVTSPRGKASSSSSSSSGGGGASSAGAAGAGGAASGFDLDFRRTARLVGFSALVGTPVAFVWFSLLDQYVFPMDPTSPLAVFSKVALDQVCMAPLMTSCFFAAMSYLEGCRSGAQVVSTVKSKLKPTLLANWTVWPLAHVINFALVPPAQRILYINVVNIAWTAFMSHMASSSEEAAPATKQEAPAPRSSKQLQQASR